MGNFTPRDALWIGVALLLLSILYGILSTFFIDILQDLFGNRYTISNIGWMTTSSILIIVGILIIILGIIFNKKKYWD